MLKPLNSPGAPRSGQVGLGRDGSELRLSALVIWKVSSTHYGLFCSKEQFLYIAMAGQHQIWRMDTASGVLCECTIRVVFNSTCQQQAVSLLGV